MRHVMGGRYPSQFRSPNYTESGSGQDLNVAFLDERDLASLKQADVETVAMLSSA